MHLSAINPYVRVALRSVLQSDIVIKQRVIYDYELIYLELGDMTFVYDGVAYACSAGDVLLICPGVPHSFHVADAPLSQPHLHFDMTERVNSERIPISYKDIGAGTIMESSLQLVSSET